MEGNIENEKINGINYNRWNGYVGHFSLHCSNTRNTCSARHALRQHSSEWDMDNWNRINVALCGEIRRNATEETGSSHYPNMQSYSIREECRATPSSGIVLAKRDINGWLGFYQKGTKKISSEELSTLRNAHFHARFDSAFVDPSRG